jgi:formylglycine-generating enzyme required for sulfatase activity/tRNA A-37 threonylcarbamoyl transferase component Bud32/dienelactone hydrolase
MLTGDTMLGEQVAHYRILSQLGTGGMGVVFLAEDVSLNRRVALKFIRADLVRSEEADARLVREARAASALDHPNVATIYEIGEWQGRHFIAMAWYDGETLAERIARGPLSIDEVVSILSQIANGLARAHAAGIVHRDLKPGNIVVTREGVAKILDFGLAAYNSPEAATETRLTAAGTTMGTIAYMAPEQAAGDRVDARADIWALGVIAYELLAGRLPFQGVHAAGLLHAIQYDTPIDVKTLRPDVPAPLRAAVKQALEKRPADRLQTADAFAAALGASRATLSPARAGGLSAIRRPVVAIPLAAMLIVVGAFAVRAIARERRAQWARDVALPEAARLADADQMVAAFELVAHAEAAVPGDPTLTRLLSTVARTVPIRSEPAGATVSYKDYQHPEAPWKVVGVTPLDGVRVPAGYLRWRFEKPGFDAVEIARLTGVAVGFQESRTIEMTLSPAGSAPPGMVLVPGSPGPFRLFLPGFEHLGALGSMGAFWIDRYEVTNADFKKFVDAGGYRRQEYWQEPFLDNDQTLSWDQAVRRFVDSTGRPGPATWIQAEYPAGEGNLPVTGVSWYEAAAYARFAGKHLPTIHHWAKAAELRAARWVVPFSNFSGRGLAAGGTGHALHASGTFDMAGNVKEWTSTDARDGRRYILGGGWDEPIYTFNDPDARAPFDRVRTFGFRCVIYVDALAPTLMAPLPWLTRDYRREQPVADQVFDIYRRLYAYDRRPLDAKVLAVSDQQDGWRRESIIVTAAYGGEQMKIFLFLPTRAAPPFETVVFFPGSNAFRTRTIEQFPITNIEFLVKSGRAVAFPEYKGTFERQGDVQDSTATPTVGYRDYVVAWIKDFSRAVDYLATRPDLSIGRLAMFGISWGARMGAIVPAIDHRVKVQVLVVGGFSMQTPQPEVDQLNFATRVSIPTLMLNGRYDFFFPVDTSQIPMFEAFRTPADRKQHLLYDGGHGIPRVELIKETLNWLDRFQPVAGTAAPAEKR